MSDVERFFEKALSTFESRIMKYFSERFSKLEERFGKYDENIKEIEHSLNSCHEHVTDVEKKMVDIEEALKNQSVQSVQSDLDGLKKVVVETQRQLNDLEQYGRRSNIRIFGMEIQENENCIDKVVSFVRESLSLNISSSDVENAHPLSSTTRTGYTATRTGLTPSKPAVIVRFRNRAIKDEILLRRKTLKGSGISISEDLTKLNINLMNRLRKEDRVDTTWSINGKVYFRVKDNTRKFQIKLFETLSEVLSKFNVN
jgi:hypothetical protein